MDTGSIKNYDALSAELPELFPNVENEQDCDRELNRLIRYYCDISEQLRLNCAIDRKETSIYLQAFAAQLIPFETNFPPDRVRSAQHMVQKLWDKLKKI